MTIIRDRVDVQVNLQTSVAPRSTFSTQLFLVDDAQIPIDLRYIYVTQSDYDTVLTLGTEPYKFAQTFFSQILTPDKLMLGRWVDTDVPPGFVSGAALETDYTVWAAIASGTFTVTDSAADADDLTVVDFTGITSLTQVPAVLNLKLAALVAPNITGLENAEFKFDSQGRLVLEMLGEAFGSPTISIGPEGTGTDLAALLDADNGISFPGVEKEEPAETIPIIALDDNSFYNVALDRSATDDQMVALGSYIETKVKQLDLVETSAAAKSSGSTSDVGYRIKALSLKRTMAYYTEQTTEYPEAAVAGAVLSTDEGTTNFAFSPISGATKSGKLSNLSVGDKTALGAKNYVWIETVGNNTYMYDGLTASGNEKRIILGVDWFEARIAEDIFSDQLRSALNSFDNDTFNKIEGIIWTYANEAVTRRIFVNTAARPFVVGLGDADDITAAERATHKLTVTDAFSGYLNSAINDYKIVGTISI